jgi:cell division protein FtsW (lipid II flippase)
MNQKLFILLLVYVLLTCLTGMLVIISTFINVYFIERTKLSYIEVFFLVICTFVWLFFLINESNHLIEQFEAVKFNQTRVEAYQNKKGVSLDAFKNFEEVFGKKFWFLPVQPDIRPNYLENILVLRKKNE